MKQCDADPEHGPDDHRKGIVDRIRTSQKPAPISTAKGRMTRLNRHLELRWQCSQRNAKRGIAVKDCSAGGRKDEEGRSNGQRAAEEVIAGRKQQDVPTLGSMGECGGRNEADG